jgi:hypothetical protein
MLKEGSGMKQWGSRTPQEINEIHRISALIVEHVYGMTVRWYRGYSEDVLTPYIVDLTAEKINQYSSRAHLIGGGWHILTDEEGVKHEVWSRYCLPYASDFSETWELFDHIARTRGAVIDIKHSLAGAEVIITVDGKTYAACARSVPLAGCLAVLSMLGIEVSVSMTASY